MSVFLYYINIVVYFYVHHKCGAVSVTENMQDNENKKLYFLLSVLLFSMINSFHAGEIRLSRSSFSIFYFSRPGAEAKDVSDSSLLPITYFRIIKYYEITHIYNVRKMRNITFLNGSHVMKKRRKH